jgi:hypothetical protein
MGLRKGIKNWQNVSEKVQDSLFEISSLILAAFS